jgi:tRNA(adenine34) deaminase
MAKKSSTKKSATRRWVRKVKTDSTHPPPRTFTGSAAEIARKMAQKDVSPKGLGSAIQMVQYFINRGGRGLSATRRRELERAKRILQRRRTSGRKTAKRRAGARTSTVRQAKRRTTAARR